jgi:ParB-like chromosome segregation protein Spo0J
MQVNKVKITEVKGNPKNPRLIKDDKFKKLVKSIQEFPQMLELRPIVVDENNIVLGGNMRLKACKEAGLKEVFIVKAEGLTELQKDEFIVKDNVGFGEWDWDILANEWNDKDLNDWGLNIPVVIDELKLDQTTIDNNKPASLKITFKTIEQLQEAENDILELIDRKYQGATYKLHIPK